MHQVERANGGHGGGEGRGRDEQKGWEPHRADRAPSGGGGGVERIERGLDSFADGDRN